MLLSEDEEKAGAGAMKEIQIHRKEIQIFRNEIQAEAEQIPNPAERNPNSDHLLSFALSKTYVAPHAAFCVFEPIPASNAAAMQALRVRLGLFDPSVFVFGSSDLL